MKAKRPSPSPMLLPTSVESSRPPHAVGLAGSPNAPSISIDVRPAQFAHAEAKEEVQRAARQGPAAVLRHLEEYDGILNRLSERLELLEPAGRRGLAKVPHAGLARSLELILSELSPALRRKWGRAEAGAFQNASTRRKELCTQFRMRLGRLRCDLLGAKSSGPLVSGSLVLARGRRDVQETMRILKRLLEITRRTVRRLEQWVSAEYVARKLKLPKNRLSEGVRLGAIRVRKAPPGETDREGRAVRKQYSLVLAKKYADSGRQTPG